VEKIEGAVVYFIGSEAKHTHRKSLFFYFTRRNGAIWYCG